MRKPGLRRHGNARTEASEFPVRRQLPAGFLGDEGSGVGLAPGMVPIRQCRRTHVIATQTVTYIQLPTESKLIISHFTRMTTYNYLNSVIVRTRIFIGQSTHEGRCCDNCCNPTIGELPITACCQMLLFSTRAFELWCSVTRLYVSVCSMHAYHSVPANCET